ncbi:hypothetical protein [Rhodopirellula sp. P2]|uniref:hypothetical protein n=1 Tax=Rhodopirellula sp. P2 TaxID=2127060 RepID=UPI0023677594|nr:hypothetical protein [Rhodopirellula sp. P2]WDQ17889.1 hypothetical protein PSR62_04885 [Rhodopirellula sp. P2]
MSDTVPELLRLNDRVTLLPIIHGSGQFAWLTRRFMLEHHFDCLAVPLPPSFQQPVEEAVLELPRPSIVLQHPAAQTTFEPPLPFNPDLTAEEYGESADDEDADPLPTSYVPIDPCQSVIMAIRAAMGEHMPRHFIDLETNHFQPFSTVMPDPHAVRHVAIEKFAAAILPSIPPPSDELTRDRMHYMAAQLTELEKSYQRILLVTSILHWPWIRDAHRQLRTNPGHSFDDIENEEVSTPTRHTINSKTLLFLFGELPFITSLHERARAELEDDENLQIDGVKELLIAGRQSYLDDLGNRARKITPLLLSKCLQYIRNLSLINRRMTPDMVTIITACKQVLGDQFALHVAEVATKYAYADEPGADSDQWIPESDQPITLGIDQARLPNQDVVSLVNRLPGPPISWQTIQLQRRPSNKERHEWQHNWNPYSQCSYPPEDERIELLRNRVSERAQAIMGQDLARTEKFTTSVKDGIDIRDTIRHWYEKEIYVKVMPPSRGQLDACLMLFDSPADPRDYPWRTTWFAEHKWESTLAFFASDFQQEMVGPGIGLGIYGGAMFLYPPVPIRDIWRDRRLNFTETLEERLIAAACMHSRSKHVAIMSPLPPGGGWKRLARRFKKHLVHVPMSSFSDQEIQQLRMVHVLNGGDVRSYAADFIRKA